jgi:hypothetical protein
MLVFVLLRFALPFSRVETGKTFSSNFPLSTLVLHFFRPERTWPEERSLLRLW